ncbi:MAG: helix-turn-helix domain-containing protein [Burkholderiaceae bacterium]|nr:helix-turn-helix domain-containing protein [Burkholderiaceae bacterium]
MTTLSRTPTAAPTDNQFLKGLHFALDGLAKELAAQLVALVEAQFAAGKASRKAVEKVVAAQVPALLQQGFITSFLADDTAVREHRAVLAHLLSAAELQATVGAGLTVLPSAIAASSADEDDELTSEAAAKLLHVSRTHLNTLADSGVFGAVRRTDGGHRRISKAALLKYKAKSQERQAKGLDAMMAASQKLGLYDKELARLPVRAGR